MDKFNPKFLRFLTVLFVTFFLWTEGGRATTMEYVDPKEKLESCTYKFLGSVVEIKDGTVTIKIKENFGKKVPKLVKLDLNWKIRLAGDPTVSDFVMGKSYLISTNTYELPEPSLGVAKPRFSDVRIQESEAKDLLDWLRKKNLKKH